MSTTKADELRKAAAKVDRWALILELLGPAAETNLVERMLEDKWKVYQQLYYDAHFKRAEKMAALTDYKVRQYRYKAAVASA